MTEAGRWYLNRGGAGGYLLRATERFEDYGMPAATRVFHAVREVLPAGKPRPPAPRDDPPYQIVLEDAGG